MFVKQEESFPLWLLSLTLCLRSTNTPVHGERITLTPHLFPFPPAPQQTKRFVQSLKFSLISRLGAKALPLLTERRRRRVIARALSRGVCW